MHRYFYEVLALTLIGGSLWFFYKAIGELGARQYVESAIFVIIGASVITVGKEVARMALIQKD